MLVAWLSEIWLNEIGRLKERGEEMSANYEALQESFRKFLNTPRVKVGNYKYTQTPFDEP